MEQNTQEEDNTSKKGPGRPRLEQTMNPEWYKIVVDAGVQGKHITQFLIELGISWEGHYRLLKTNKKYSEAFMQYEKLCEDWWFNKAYESMSENNGAGFNTRLWQVIMTNKFKKNWKSEKHIDVTTQGEKIDNTTGPIQIEIIKAQMGNDGTEGES
jgi:hypothetical protein